jgi:hypothetical protein
LGPESTFDVHFRDNDKRIEFALTMLELVLSNNLNAQNAIKMDMIPTLSEIIRREPVTEDTVLSGCFKAAVRCLNRSAKLNNALNQMLDGGALITRLLAAIVYCNEDVDGVTITGD